MDQEKNNWQENIYNALSRIGSTLYSMSISLGELTSLKNREINPMNSMSSSFQQQRKEQEEEDRHRKQVEEAKRQNKINTILAGIAFLSLVVNIIFLFTTSKSTLKANIINKQIAEIEYENSQPFLVIVGGDEKEERIKIQNAGGGPAKNIVFLKHYLNASSTSIFVLTKEQNVGLAIPSGKEGNVNLNEQFMDRVESSSGVLERIECFPEENFSDNKNWIMAFYENIRGEKFASKFHGTGGLYAEAVDFIKLSDCKK